MEVKSQLTHKAQRDYDLVLEAIKGSQDAYAELMKNYKDSLYFMLLKMTNNDTDAEDLTIEEFVSKVGVEALAVSVLPGRASLSRFEDKPLPGSGSDIGCLGSHCVDPVPNLFSDKLWSH